MALAMIMKSTVVLASVAVLARGACDCEWQATRNKCDLSVVATANALKDSNTPLAAMAQGAAACKPLSNASCTSNADCKWSSEGGLCDIGEDKMMKIMMGSATAQDMMQKALACALLTTTTCSGNNDCKVANNECAMDEGAVMAALAGPEVAAFHAKEKACEALTTSGTCGGNSDCKWESNKSRCETTQATMIKAMGGNDGAALAAKATACEQDQNKADCDMCIESGITDWASPFADHSWLVLGALLVIQRIAA